MKRTLFFGNLVLEGFTVLHERVQYRYDHASFQLTAGVGLKAAPKVCLTRLHWKVGVWNGHAFSGVIGILDFCLVSIMHGDKASVMFARCPTFFRRKRLGTWCMAMSRQ